MIKRIIGFVVALIAITVMVITFVTFFQTRNKNFDDLSMAKSMEVIKIDDKRREQLEGKYNTLSDVEKKLGINLLQHDDAYKTDISLVEVESYKDGNLVVVNCSDYYMVDCELDLETAPDGSVIKDLSDDSYRISYSALMFTEKVDIKMIEELYRDFHQDVDKKEEFSIGDEFEGEIFMLDSEYFAMITHDGVLYIFSLDANENADHTPGVNQEKIKDFIKGLK